MVQIGKKIIQNYTKIQQYFDSIFRSNHCEIAEKDYFSKFHCKVLQLPKYVCIRYLITTERFNWNTNTYENKAVLSIATIYIQRKPVS